MPLVPRPLGPPGRVFLRALATNDPRHVVGLFGRLASEHPRIGYARAFSEHIYVLSHPDLIHEVLATRSRSTMKSRALQMAKYLLGEGLLTSEGELHRRDRRLVAPAFHQRRITRYADEMVAATVELGERWRDGARVDMAAEMGGLTLEVVGRTLFGADLRVVAADVAGALDEILPNFRRTLMPYGAVMLRLPIPWARRSLAAAARIDRVVRELIARRRTETGTQTAGADDRGDLLSSLLLAREDGRGLSDEQVRDEAVTLVLAGHETTANALAWTWYLLSRHPEAAEDVYAEVDRVVGPRLPGHADLAALPRTTAAFAESMRLFPPSWVMGRRVTAPIILDGWTVPTGSLCLMSQWAMHRDRRFWDRPLNYRPGRWLGRGGDFDETAPGQPRAAWFPFGMGGRRCVGESFAWTEGVLVLATLCRHWRAELPRGFTPTLEPAITLRPRGELPMILRRR